MRTILIAICLLAGVALAESAVPEDFNETFARLASLVDSEEVGVLDMARGTYDATRFISVGKEGAPVLETRFLKATTFGEASVAGLYLTVWGREGQLSEIQRELETNPLKRKWLYGMVGTEDLFWNSIGDGGKYQPLLRLLPSIGGTRSLALRCMQSKDPLVRRAGLFWGYWLADKSYWDAVGSLAKSDDDRTTLRVVQRLLLNKKS
ncbi:MAG: hypothetical protein M5U15_05895 [Kiritimatiellae bacterium]|nr:hypothetical protein [Kiritimatiellia bacterium]